MSAHTLDSSAPDPHTYLALARQIRQAALDTEGVASISKGRSHEVATRWLGEKVLGVAVNQADVELHVVAQYPSGFPVADRRNITTGLRARRASAPIEDGVTPPPGQGPVEHVRDPGLDRRERRLETEAGEGAGSGRQLEVPAADRVGSEHRGRAKRQPVERRQRRSERPRRERDDP